MKVLIVSHNVLGYSTAMGKTLMSYFQDMEDIELAQFYIHSEVPTQTLCKNYYRFSDQDALAAHNPFKSYGKIFLEKDIQTERKSSRTDVGMKAKVYQYSRRRSPLIYIGRNLVWNTTRWKTPQLKMWIQEFQPDVVFFASGDYAFIYDMALEISKIAKCPLVVSCMDDYYVQNRNQGRFLGEMYHKYLFRHAKKVIDQSALLLCMCPKMKNQYAQFFKTQSEVLYTPYKIEKEIPKSYGTQISYMGSLGLQRHQQLMDLGKALAPLGKWVDVYSADRNEAVLEEIKKAEGIHFHGPVDAKQIEEIMHQSCLVVHTESFEKRMMDRVRYSISTKIAESLLVGPCLLAYGPNSIASIEYLKENHAAYVIDEKNQLEEKLVEILNNESIRNEILKNARALGNKNHKREIVQTQLKSWMERVKEEWNETEQFEGTSRSNL